MKKNVKYVLTRLHNGAERRFNKLETAIEFARRECIRWGYGDIDDIIDGDDKKYFEIFVDICGNKKLIFSIELEVTFDD